MKWILVFLVLFLSSCSLLPELKENSTETKFMMMYPEIEKQNVQTNKTIKIILPTAPQFLYTYDITYTKGDGIYGAYLYNHWDETPAKQLQFLLANALTQSGIFKNVVIDPSKSDFGLSLESRVDRFEFFAKSSNSEVRIDMILYLVDSQENSIIKSKRFMIRQKVTNISPKGVVMGFNEAIVKLDNEVIEWLRVTHE